MHIALGQEVWALVAQAASAAGLRIEAGFGQVDQTIYPGQQWLRVGWGPLAGEAPRLFVYRSSGDKQYTSAQSGDLCVDKEGDWTPPDLGNGDDGWSTDPRGPGVEERLDECIYTLTSLCAELGRLKAVEEEAVKA